MPNRQSTVFVFLIDRKGVPRFRSEKYLCSVIETPQTSSFSPACLTHDNKKNRSNIIQLIDQLKETDVTNIEGLRNVGEAVWGDLGLVRILKRIVSSNQEVTFISNDPAVPWEWASPEKGQSVCEQLSCGNVFFEQLSQVASGVGGRRTWDTPEEHISKMKAILLFDEGGHDGLTRLPRAKAEIHAIKTVLLQAGLKEENVKIIDGDDKHAEPAFLREVRRTRDDLGVIHYAGHILNGDIQLKHSAIERSEIYDNFPDNYLSHPLVFINGCESGSIADVWEKGKNLSTSWLSAGALAVLACRLPIEDLKAIQFASAFYSKLLSKPYSYESLGTVLRDTRKDFLKKAPDASWLQYTLIGHPHVRLFEPKRTEAEVAATLISAEPSDEFTRLLVEASDAE